MFIFVIFLITSTCNRATSVNAFVSTLASSITAASVSKLSTATPRTATELQVLPSISLSMVATRPDLLARGFLSPAPTSVPKKTRIFLPEEKHKESASTSSPSGTNKKHIVQPHQQAISLVDITWLKPHEEITGVDRVQELYESVIECDAYIVPLLVDSRSGAILDGHHRYAVGRIMELDRLPVVLVDYLNDESITLDVWPGCGIDCLTKQEVVEMSLSKNLFPPKTSRHDCVRTFAPIHVPLDKLRRRS